jgi:RHS repeat-associated protein
VWDNGSSWARDLDGDWDFNGQATHVTQTGASLHFINENGGQSIGHFVDINHVEATDWNDLGAVLSPGEIAWVNQSLWTRDEPTPAVLKATKEVQYTYDVYDRLIHKSVDDYADGSIDRAESYVYDGDDVVASFDAAGSLTHRYLHGPAVDQVFADEDALAEILWGLPDNQGTIRDVADYDAASDTTTITNHRSFDSFGNMTESNAAVHLLFAWTGRYYDKDTGEQLNGERWYDAKTARWLSEDPIHDDVNTYRYVRNNPVNLTDPSGLAPPWYKRLWWKFGGNARGTFDTKIAPVAYGASAGALDALSFNKFSKLQQYAAAQRGGRIKYNETAYGVSHKCTSTLQIVAGGQGLVKGLTVKAGAAGAGGIGGISGSAAVLRPALSISVGLSKAGALSGAVAANGTMALMSGGHTPGSGTAGGPRPTPKASDAKLQNLVNDLYKGAKGPKPIGSGSTADAVRNEILTGKPTHGRFHFQKAREYIAALTKWLKKNPGASDCDKGLAKALLDDLKTALGGK